MANNAHHVLAFSIAEQFRNCSLSESTDVGLHRAAFEGNLPMLKEIFRKGVPKEIIDQRDHLGYTALRFAATAGHEECIALLLKNGASVDITDVKCETPLFVAVKNSHYECAKLLLENGADPNGNGGNRNSPLCVAAMNGCLDLLQLLLKFKAEIFPVRRNVTGVLFKVDPIRVTLAYHRYECLKALLSAGGRPLDMQVKHSFFTGVSSSYHMVVKHKCGVEYAELLYEFGLSPFVKDDKGFYAWQLLELAQGEEDAQTKDLLQFFDKRKEVPRNLRSCCRLSVLDTVISLNKSMSDLNSLTMLPENIKKYLTFEQLF